MFRSLLTPLIAAVVTLALLAGLLAAWHADSPADATFPGTNGLIAFISNRDGDFDIYTMPVGGIATRLTTAAGLDGHPAWSANGDRIAFISHRDEPTARRDQIYVMNADGTGQTALTSGPIESNNPTWSPDGTKIAFQRSIGCCNAEIFVMNDDGSDQTNLTNDPSSDIRPDWSPDGTQIAFVSNRNGGDSIFIMDSDGSNQTLLISGGSDPSWSPDGSQLAFYWSPIQPEIYVVDADGSNVTALTNNDYFVIIPVWSPDGARIAFHTTRPEDSNRDEIYVMNADGSGQTNVTNNPAFDGEPDWQPLVATPNPPLSLPVGGIVELVAGPSDAPDAQPRGRGPEREVAALAVAMAAVGVAGVFWHRYRRQHG